MGGDLYPTCTHTRCHKAYDRSLIDGTDINSNDCHGSSSDSSSSSGYSSGSYSQSSSSRNDSSHIYPKNGSPSYEQNPEEVVCESSSGKSPTTSSSDKSPTTIRRIHEERGPDHKKVLIGATIAVVFAIASVFFERSNYCLKDNSVENCPKIDLFNQYTRISGYISFLTEVTAGSFALYSVANLFQKKVTVEELVVPGKLDQRKYV